MDPMSFRITTSSLSRQRIQIRSVSDLLPFSKHPVTQPQHNLTTKIFFPSYKSTNIPTTIVSARIHQNRRAQMRGQDQRRDSEAFNLQEIPKVRSLSKFEGKNNEMPKFENEAICCGSQKYRSTMMDCFRYHSVDSIQGNASRTSSQKIWTAFNYDRSILPKQHLKSISKKKESDKQQSEKIQKNVKKMQFLKKGSNINKRVVVNLLKLKLTGRSNIKGPSSADTDNTIRNNEIMNMIKIYKGYGQDPELVTEKRTSKMREVLKQQIPDIVERRVGKQTIPFPKPQHLDVGIEVEEYQPEEGKQFSVKL